MELLRIRARGIGEGLGRDYGRQVRTQVALSLAGYEAIFREGGWSWDRARRFATERVAGLDSASPRLMAELRGIADGASVDFADILALNLRTEILQASSWSGLTPSECTALGVGSIATVDGHALLAQNWDFPEAVSGTVVALEVESPDRPFLVTFVEAGLLAKTGMNEHGIGLVTNALVVDTGSGPDGLPYHFVLRDILESRRLSMAIGAVTSNRRASSANYLIGDRDGVIFDIEAAPGDHRRVNVLEPAGGLIAHANHFVQDPWDAHDFAASGWMDSWVRLERMHHLLDDGRGSISPAGLEASLRDHENFPDSICRHPDPEKPAIERSTTHASVIYDLTDRQIRLAFGRPCETEYHPLDIEWPTSDGPIPMRGRTPRPA